MKTILFTIVIIFSFTEANAQDIASETTPTNEIENFKSSKVGFYKALIAKNNFDIKIKEPIKVVATSNRSAYYEALMIKNGFITKTNKKKSIRLVNNAANNQKDSSDINKTITLLP
ncbi:hypothetical protein GCM10022393_00140 [Aquimarina addita]|uniref:Uncharacterized protein n=1 Tax=Aquimarina addita TaxID=870485 RepID=A0ABP7X7C9_9FLAO